MELGLLILLVIFATNVVSWIGKSVLVELAFAAYQPFFLRPSYTKQRALKKEILANKAELNATSSQDQFAKWAKLRRKLDKGLADLEKLNGSLSSHRSRFTSLFSTLLYVFTSGLQLVLCWYYRRQPVFWLPYGWTPNAVSWVLSFGGGPKGSISVTAWSFICKRVITTIEDLVKEWIPEVMTMFSKASPAASASANSDSKTEPKLAAPVPASASTALEKKPVPIEDDVIEVD